MLNGYQLFIHMFLGCRFGLQRYLEGAKKQKKLGQDQILQLMPESWSASPWRQQRCGMATPLMKMLWWQHVISVYK